MCEKVPTGVSGPVLYVKRSGVYKYVVTLGSETCTSKEIEVYEGWIVHYNYI